MKFLLTFVTLFLLFGGVASANKNCLKMLNEYVPSDNMIKLVYLTEKNLTFYINNIRNFKSIDISQYGFDSAMAKEIEKKHNCPKTIFLGAYDSNGISKSLKIKNKYLKNFKNQTIVAD